MIRRALLPLALVVLSGLPSFAEGTRSIAVRTPAGMPGLAAELRDSGWIRWMLSRQEGVTVEVGPEVDGETLIVVAPMPP